MPKEIENVRVRIAPSPTGPLHLGTARTALFNWLFARRHNGIFILRIEDTDLERSSPEFENDIIEGLRWLGLQWDEGPVRQSERLDSYEKCIRKLLDNGKAFWCYHTIEELERERNEQMKAKEAPRHVCSYKSQTTNHKPQNTNGIVRLAVNHYSTRVIRFEDIVRGDITFEERLLGDISIAKDERTPLYNFAVVVDDNEMRISHVIRGEDHISNTPKQILFQEALGFPRPEYAHLPLILGPDKSKLSKRHGATSVNEYKKDYLPEALVNFMGFLGYTHEKEILSRKEMADGFDLAKVHKSGAIFDLQKLGWINNQYFRNIDIENLRQLTGMKELQEEARDMITERLEKLSDAAEFEYFVRDPEYDAALLVWKKSTPEEAKNRLINVREVLSSRIEWELFDEQYIRRELDNLNPADRGAVYWPLRVALTGKKTSPDPVDIMRAIGGNATLRRVEKAIQKLSI